jgi:anti-sigma B factor antagonist
VKKIAIEGALTIYEASTAMTTLLAALEGATGLEVDLSNVSELDTAGAQLLMLVKREAEAAGKDFALSGESPAVREVFDCYGLHAHFAPVRPQEGTR